MYKIAGFYFLFLVSFLFVYLCIVFILSLFHLNNGCSLLFIIYLFNFYCCLIHQTFAFAFRLMSGLVAAAAAVAAAATAAAAATIFSSFCCYLIFLLFPSSSSSSSLLLSSSSSSFSFLLLLFE